MLYMSGREGWLRCARNAWQKLGTMNPEAAMEQYIMLLNKSIPGLDEKVCERSSFLQSLYNRNTLFYFCLLLMLEVNSCLLTGRL